MSLRVLLPAMIALLAGCNRGGHTGPVGLEVELELLALELTDGVTSREEIRAALGPPCSSFEADRLWSYALLPRSNGRLAVSAREREASDPEYLLWKHKSYNLILVFDGDILKRHTLLRIS